MENYQNLVGKLLAGENITILHKRMETAAFDVKNRTLYLPIWKDMTPEINDMLICHEVSHALFTPMDYVDALETRLKFRNAKAYLNILEDIRVEKLIKRRYPGIKKSFSVGYNQLNAKDFFGLKGEPLHKRHLMDKINLFYKVGYNCGVTFTEKEKEFVDKMKKLEEILIPENIDFQQLKSLSNEGREKLTRIKPQTIGQASRISGVSPADISILLVFLGR